MRIVEGEIEIKSVSDFLKRLNCNVVLIDANYVVDIDHVEFAVKKAIKAWNENRRVARTLVMEILLYVAARRQINEAIKIGPKSGRNEIVAVLLDDECLESLKELGFKEKKVLKIDDKKIERIKEFFDISDEELRIVGIGKLPLLIRERIVLFDIFKSS